MATSGGNPPFPICPARHLISDPRLETGHSPPVALVLVLQVHLRVSGGLLVVVGLGMFGFVFAVISSLHSYLILACAGSKEHTEDVGFYYAANAAGGSSAS
jgi:hypothetical protein